MSELRHAVQSILRNPAFTLAALLTIALGIGANTAVYSIVHAVLIQPLPFHQPEALVQVWETHPELHNFQVAVPDYLDWKNSIKSLDLAAFTFQAMNKATLLDRGDPVEVQATQASSNLFTVLGVRPLLGRAFDSQQEQAHDPVVLISEKLWRSKFSADPHIIGRSLHLDLTSYTIVGVFGQKQAFPVWADVWMPLSFLEPELQTTRKYHPLEVIGRLRPGVSLRQAELETEMVARGLSAAYPATNGKIGAFAVPLMEEVTGKVRPALLTVWMAVGLVLLIACANLAHLAMARALNRRRDVAVRLALGASRITTVREFFLETASLSLVGGLLGMLVAAGALPALRNLAQGRIPRLEGVTLDASAFGFGLLLSLTVSLLFAAPAFWRVMRADLNETMRSDDVRGSSARGSWAGPFLMSSEIALSLAVLLAATMLVRSFALTLDADPGFRADGMLTVDMPLARDWNASYELFTNRVVPELKGIAGVLEVAAVNSAPMSLGLTEHSRFATRFGIVGKMFDPGEFPTAQIRWCSASYFQTLGIQLERGRLLSEADHGQPRYVVNEAFARRFFPREDPVGRKLLLNVVSPQPQSVEIVGVVGDTRDFGLDMEPEPTIYLDNVSLRMDVLVKVAGNPMLAASSVAAAMRRVNPDGAIGPVRTLRDSIDSSLTRQRFALVLITAFAGLGIVLCVVGIYGVFGYSVSQRLREFAIRAAVGAQRRDLVAMILRQCLVVLLPGLTAGMLISAACSHFLKTLLYRVSPTDALSYSVAVSCVLVLCLGSAVVPAMRAAKVDPARVLHEQ